MQVSTKTERPREGTGPAFLEELRDRAWSSFLTAPAPDRAVHLWRYSDPAAWELADEPVQHGVDVLPELPEGVTVLPLDRAAVERPELVESHLGTLVGSSFGRFEALNLARFAGGLLVHVEPGRRIEQPLDLRTDLSTLKAGLLADRLLIVIGAGAEATVITGLRGGEHALLANRVVEVFVEAGAHLNLSTVLAQGKKIRTFLTQRVRVERDGKVVQTVASLGGKRTKADLGSVLTGPGAEVGMYGFVLGEGKQQFDHHTVHHHQAPHTLSNLNFKVVLRDRAHSAYTGIIRIDEGAPKTEAYQENRNLLLTDGTRAESIPELEILTDDVRCTHGATTGPIDEGQVFYLLSRGLSRPEAVRVIVQGFIAPTLERLPKDLAEALADDVERSITEL